MYRWNRAKAFCTAPSLDFHTLEYLLFGLNGSKQVSDFIPRQFEYLLACGQVLRENTDQLYNGWKVTEGNFARHLLQTGHTDFLHDGRTRNLTEAILWHGGEGEAAMTKFTELSKADREALLAFLNSL